MKLLLGLLLQSNFIQMAHHFSQLYDINISASNLLGFKNEKSWYTFYRAPKKNVCAHDSIPHVCHHAPWQAHAI